MPDSTPGGRGSYRFFTRCLDLANDAGISDVDRDQKLEDGGSEPDDPGEGEPLAADPSKSSLTAVHRPARTPDAGEHALDEALVGTPPVPQLDEGPEPEHDREGDPEPLARLVREHLVDFEDDEERRDERGDQKHEDASPEEVFRRERWRRGRRLRPRARRRVGPLLELAGEPEADGPNEPPGFRRRVLRLCHQVSVAPIIDGMPKPNPYKLDDKVLASREQDGTGHEDGVVVDVYSILIGGDEQPMVVVEFPDEKRVWLKADGPDVMPAPEEEADDEGDDHEAGNAVADGDPGDEDGDG